MLLLALAPACASQPRATPRPAAEASRPELADRDEDRLADDRDRCPTAPEDEDGFEDDDGCPDDDDDADGLLDRDDLCAREPEDADGLADDDGCPETDVDRDRIDDARDACPTDAETYDGHDDDDGCPDVGLVFVDGDLVVVIERIAFAPWTTRPGPGEEERIAELAAILVRDAGLRSIALDGVVGHGDERLARRRAEALKRRLVHRGIAPERLVVRVFPSPRRPDVTPGDGSDTVEVTALDPRDRLAR